MLAVIWIFVAFSSGSVFATAYYKRRWEETVPLTVFSMVALLYVFALFDLLKLGGYLLTAAVFLLYLTSLVKLAKQRQLRPFIANTLTPAFFVFLLLFAACLYVTYGMTAHDGDDFSHWADTVKILYYSDMLGTKAQAGAWYGSYPPAMSLLQYYFMQFKGGFGEWIMYFVHKVYVMALLLPFLQRLRSYKPLKIVLITGAYFLSLMLFGEYFYNSLLIDSVLAAVFGFLAAYAFVYGIDEKRHFAVFCLGIANLLLLKDAGKLFAAFLAVLALILLLESGAGLKAKLRRSGILLLSFLFPMLSWKAKIALDHVLVKHGQSYDLANFIDVLLGRDLGYRHQVLESYISAFFQWEYDMGPISLSNFTIMLVLAFLLFLMARWCRSEGEEKRQRRVLQLVALCSVVFIVGLLPSYMYKFPEDQALILDAYQRYMNIIWAGLLMLVFLVLTEQMLKREGMLPRVMAFYLAICLLIPGFAVYRSLSRYDAKFYARLTQGYEDSIDIVRRNQDPEKIEKIWLVIQGAKGPEYNYLHYLLRPDMVSPSSGLAEAPYAESDGRMTILSLQQWQEQLFSSYDLVFVNCPDEQFIQSYGLAFEDPSSIDYNTLYRVDKERGLLVQLH